MSDTAILLLKTFETLSPAEQHTLLVELLRRSGELPDTVVTDDDLVGLADQLFQMLDAEDDHGADTNKG